MGMKRSVLLSLVLMAVSNFSFALLAAAGHSNWGMAGAIGFENFASGVGGVTVVAYFSALCDLRFTASQYALISAAASRSEEHTSELQSLMRISYAVFCLKKTNTTNQPSCNIKHANNTDNSQQVKKARRHITSDT